MLQSEIWIKYDHRYYYNLNDSREINTTIGDWAYPLNKNDSRQNMSSKYNQCNKKWLNESLIYQYRNDELHYYFTRFQTMSVLMGNYKYLYNINDGRQNMFPQCMV